jgi:hypothetical protein
VGVAGVLGNGGSAHPLTYFSVLGYHVTGSAGTLFLAGIVVGAAGLLGLSLVLAGARRTSRRDTARADAASNLTNGTAIQDAPPGPTGDRWARLRDIRHRLTPPQARAVSDSPAPSAPASSHVRVGRASRQAGSHVVSRVLDAHATTPRMACRRSAMPRAAGPARRSGWT